MGWVISTSETAGLGAYTDWDMEMSDGADMLPIFSEFTIPTECLSDTDDPFRALILSPDPTYGAIPDFEVEMAQAALAGHGADQPLTYRLFHYWAAEHVEHLRSSLRDLGVDWKVLHVAPPVPRGQIPHLGGGAGAPLTTRQPQGRPSPIVALIDDSIGYLNTRFQQDARTTRFLAIWQQRVGMAAGQVLNASDINDRLTDPASEQEIYARDNALLLRPEMVRPLARRAAHGTHVLDLAAGADEGEDMAGVPILAVQLPPEATRDTSGRILKSQIAQGLRWLRYQAWRANAATPQSLIVNLSLGTLAGPGDDRAFLADMLDWEMDQYRAMTGQDMRVVAAYGNARLDRTVARSHVHEGKNLCLRWMMPADDHTASYLELRRTEPSDDMQIQLVGPQGQVITMDWPSAGQGHWLSLGNQRIALMQGMQDGALDQTGAPEPSSDCVMIAISPTETRGGGRVAPSGIWRVGVRKSGEGEPVVTARILRDDSIAGYGIQGRQSRLIHSKGTDWEGESGAWTAPHEDSTISRQGTATSLAGLAETDLMPSIYTVAAGRRPDGAERMTRIAPYSSQGMQGNLSQPGESRGPVIVAAGDTAMLLGGVAASGAYSGSRVRLSGTSAATPQVTRRIVETHLARAGQADVDVSLVEAEMSAMFGMPPNELPQRDTRRGHGVLVSK